MAHGSHEFVLDGYSEYLEGRPLKFVDPIPATLICCACGHIPRLTFSLVCGHVFCGPCYRSSATTSECVCPLDGEVSGTDDVTSKKYPAEILLRRKVHCCNEASGCRVVLPASQVAQHVRYDCQHNVTRCPTCFAVVRCPDVCAHLKSRCAAHVLHAAPQRQQREQNNEHSHFDGFQGDVTQRVRELDAKLAQLSLESESQSGELVKVCHNINHLKEALAEQFGTSSVQTLDRLDRNEAELKALLEKEKTIEQRVGELDAKLAQLCLKSDSLRDKLNEICHDNSHLKVTLTEQFGQALDRNVAEIKTLYTEKSESLKTTLTSLLKSVLSVTGTHQWVLKGYAALKKKALKDGCSLSLGDKVYLRGYLMTLGIKFRKDGESVNFALCLQLHKGKQDDYLEWPFDKEWKLSIIHPETRKELDRSNKPYLCDANNHFFSRPTENGNTIACFYASRVQTSDIERDGYVKSDQLLLRFEVL